MKIRPARSDELAELSELCMRSKAWWGYDETFMEACREELSLVEAELQRTSVAVLELEGAVAGVAQVDHQDDWAEVDKLFVDPGAIGTGAGRVLWNWCVEAAKAQGASRLKVVADPGAAPFYEHMGAVPDGVAPSGSIPGRTLPRLRFDL